MTQTTDEIPTGTGHADRRRFLITGGAGIAAAAFLAACGDSVDTSDDFPLTGTAPTTSDAKPEEIGPEFDITMLRTAQSLELGAIEGLKQLSSASFGYGPDVLPTFETLIERHTSHAEYFAQQTTQAGGTPYDEPNPYMMETVVDPGVEALAAEPDAFALAVVMENTLAQTYVFAGELMSTVELRQAVATVGFVAARQISTVYVLEGGNAAPTPAITRGARVPAKAYVPES